MWRAERDDLFRNHPQSALSTAQKAGFAGLPYYDYDPTFRVVAQVDTDVEPLQHAGEIGDDGRATRAVGSTVDVESATYTNTIGDALLGAFWEDPDFDPSRRAFYYVRVLEIPTPTWIAYDEQVFGPRDAPDEALRVHQERAYTSPIWYTP